MIKGYLFVAGASEVGIDYENGKYYVNADIINNDGYDYFMEISKKQFRDVLLNIFKWIPNSWNEELKQEYQYLLNETI